MPSKNRSNARNMVASPLSNTSPTGRVTKGAAARKRSNKKNKKSQGTSMTAMGRERSFTVAAPASVGMVIPQSYLKVSDDPQKLAEISSESAVRVRGCDLFNLPIKAGSTTVDAGFGGTGVYSAPISPNNISDRLAQYEEMYQFYAFRHLNVIYVPNVGSNTNASLALGILQDANEYIDESGDAPTQQQVLQFTPSLLSPVWQASSMEYVHEAIKLWETSSSFSDAVDSKFDQAVFFCTLLGGVASTVYGQLWIEYVVDFYKPTPILSNPALTKEVRRKLHEIKSYTDSRPENSERLNRELSSLLSNLKAHFIDNDRMDCSSGEVAVKGFVSLMPEARPLKR